MNTDWGEDAHITQIQIDRCTGIYTDRCIGIDNDKNRHTETQTQAEACSRCVGWGTHPQAEAGRQLHLLTLSHSDFRNKHTQQ